MIEHSIRTPDILELDSTRLDQQETCSWNYCACTPNTIVHIMCSQLFSVFFLSLIHFCVILNANRKIKKKWGGGTWK